MRSRSPLCRFAVSARAETLPGSASGLLRPYRGVCSAPNDDTPAKRIGQAMRNFVPFFALIGLLAACGQGPVRYAAAPVPSGAPIGISVSQLEVREVSLPAYARTEEIWREAENGALSSDSSVLWADEPERGVTMELSRHLATMTGARVAAEPWPFEDLPQARLTVRVQDMVAGADGQFRMTGQYFVASLTAGRDRSGEFRVSAPYALDGGAPAIAAARAQAVRDLARLIADRGF